MRLYELTTRGQDEFRQKLIPNPFPSSKITHEVYHGSPNIITRFNRPANGVWFAEFPEWCTEHYCNLQGNVYVCWVNVKNPYTPTEEENDLYYSEPVEVIAPYFNALQRKGYDAYIQGGESGSLAVFSSVEIINALTGKRM